MTVIMTQNLLIRNIMILRIYKSEIDINYFVVIMLEK